VTSIPTSGEVYSLHVNVIKFVSDLPQVGVFDNERLVGHEKIVALTTIDHVSISSMIFRK
jgi:hypothetical protein